MEYICIYVSLISNMLQLNSNKSVGVDLPSHQTLPPFVSHSSNKNKLSKLDVRSPLEIVFDGRASEKRSFYVLYGTEEAPS